MDADSIFVPTTFAKAESAAAGSQQDAKEGIAARVDHASHDTIDPTMENPNGADESLINASNEISESQHSRFEIAEQRPRDWQLQLNSLNRNAQRTGELPRNPTPQNRGGGGQQVWYVIDVAASVQAKRLRIQLYTRQPKKNGELGKLKTANLRRSHVDTLDDPRDREVLPFLFDRLVDFETSYGYYRNDWQTLSSCLLNAGACDVLLPKISTTGRLAWLLDTDLPAEEARQVHWDDGDPWEFRPAIREFGDEQCWRISGELIRGDERRSLSDAVLMLAPDIVLFPESVASTDLGDASLWLNAILEHSVITIPFADREAFLTSLASWPLPADLELPASLQIQRTVGKPRGRVLFHKPEWHGDSQLFADVSFMYAAPKIDIFDTETAEFEDAEVETFEASCTEVKSAWYDPENDRMLFRDRHVEETLIELLYAQGFQKNVSTTYRSGDLKLARRRFADVVQQLVGAGWLVESEGNPIRSAGNFSLSVKTDIDWFELDGKVDFEGVSVSLPRLLAAVQAGQRLIQLGDGSAGMLPEKWLTTFNSLATLAETKDDTLRFAPSQALLLDVLLAEQDQVTLDKGFVRVRNKLRSFDGVKGRNEPRGFRGELREYQRVGLGWMQFLRDFQFGGCLADDMGLGKTIQVLAMLQTRRLGRKSDRRASLVVVPKSLVFNWIDEAEKFTPNLRVVNYTGLGRKEYLDQLADVDLVVTTYGTLRRDITELKDVEFDYAILDESQAIKNHNSQAAKACRLLRSRYRLAMTGTPIENHLGELWSLFEFLNPGMLGRTTSFNALAKSASNEDSGTLEALATAIRPFVLRRTKQQVLTELPEKTEQTLFCELAPTQRKYYNEMRDFYRLQLAGKVEENGLAKSKIHVLEALLRLRQAACHPGLIDKKKRAHKSAKVDALLEQVEEVVGEGHKTLVFSQFTSLLSIVREQLDRKKIVYEYLDGKTRNRNEKVKRFQEDPDCGVFLISLKAGGSGLNLTAADYVFILDPWWNPAVEAQAIDRTHRIGQTRRVFAYRLIAQDTVEEKILELQKSKRKLADALNSADDSVIRNLTTEDLQLLLS